MIDCGCLCFANRHDGICLGMVERPDAVISKVRDFPIMMCRPCGENAAERHPLITDDEAIELADRLDPANLPIAGTSWHRWFLDQVRGRV